MFTFLKTILWCRCPKCNIGKLFVDKNPYHFKNLSKMENECPHCKLNLAEETGFYFMSMYTSYILSVGISVLFLIPFTILFGLDWIAQLLIINTLILLILWPFIFRWARILSMWISLKWKTE